MSTTNNATGQCTPNTLYYNREDVRQDRNEWKSNKHLVQTTIKIVGLSHSDSCKITSENRSGEKMKLQQPTIFFYTSDILLFARKCC